MIKTNTNRINNTDKINIFLSSVILNPNNERNNFTLSFENGKLINMNSNIRNVGFNFGKGWN